MYKIYIKKGNTTISVLADYFRISYDNLDNEGEVLIRTCAGTLLVSQEEVISIKKYVERKKRNS